MGWCLRGVPLLPTLVCSAAIEGSHGLIEGLTCHWTFAWAATPSDFAYKRHRVSAHPRHRLGSRCGRRGNRGGKERLHVSRLACKAVHKRSECQKIQIHVDAISSRLEAMAQHVGRRGVNGFGDMATTRSARGTHRLDARLHTSTLLQDRANKLEEGNVGIMGQQSVAALHVRRLLA